MIFDLPVSDKNTRHGNLKFRLFLALLADVDVDSFPAAVQATISANVLLAGKTFKYIDCQINSIKPNAKPGESPYTGKLVLTPILEGISKASLDWLYKNLGEDVIAVWERCSDGQKFIGGSPCSGGLKVKFTSVGDLNGGISGIALSLEGGECPEPFWFYDGDIPRDTPEVIELAEATTFALTAKTQYTMTDNAAAKALSDITAVADGDVGRIIELVGAGVNNPTSIASSAKFILKNGVTFSAANGNRIFFQITKTGAGAYAFYEVFRA